MPLPNKERRFQLFKRLWPHFLIVSAAIGYLLIGGYLFFLIETRWAQPAVIHFDQDKRPEGWACPGGDAVSQVHAASRACAAWKERGRGGGRNGTAGTAGTADCERALLKLAECVQRRGGRSLSTGTGRNSPEEWTWATGVILAFTIVTTIGYGEVTPKTSAGRVFCIIYGIFGIPLVLLALANQGRFFSSWLLYAYKNSKRFVRWIKSLRLFRKSARPVQQSSGSGQPKPLTLNGLLSSHLVSDDSTSLTSSEDNVEQTIPASVLLCIISGYLALGGYLIGEWEADERWSFVDSTYFVFTSAASIGFGDLVPTNRSRMPLTFIYICLGLALTTTAIDIFAEYLRRLHYWGMKIKNAASTFVWFGGNKVTINQLVRTIGHELGASEDKIKTIVRHLDSVISMAIQEADEQQEIVEDLQFVEPFIPASDERVLVHTNSFEFGIAEASLLSPLIFSPPDQQQNVIVNNNHKARSMTSMESLKSFGEAVESRPLVQSMKRAASGGSDTIQFIDSSSITMTVPHRLHVTRSVASVQSATRTTSTPRTESPREMATFVHYS